MANRASEYAREWRARNVEHLAEYKRAKRLELLSMLATLKLVSGCVDCGYADEVDALQFDHVRGVKVKNVSGFMSLARALEEAEKCDVRCANCHAIKTAREERERRAA